mmetsp:Transcript_13825/g.22906  ORF Transcript_13825/g.22906 Transcript_13825/m.22906 type:complete len:99 (+) Transcript_13825:26-322(+)
MVSRAVFSRSRPLLARYDVSPHLVKWWAKVKPDDGQVTRHLSPFEQHAIMGWFQTWPGKLMDRAPQWIMYVGGSLGLSYAIITLGDAADAAEDYKHRF